MYSETTGTHNLPHIHASYAEHEIVIALDGTILEGSLPGNKMKLLLAWMEINSDELYVNWTLLGEGKPHRKIKPLR